MLFTRIRAVLRPGAPLCVLDLYDRPEGQRASLASILGLFFPLTSGANTYGVDEVSRWMRESGYGSVEAKSFRTLPDLRRLIARAAQGRGGRAKSRPESPDGTSDSRLS